MESSFCLKRSLLYFRNYPPWSLNDLVLEGKIFVMVWRWSQRTSNLCGDLQSTDVRGGKRGTFQESCSLLWRDVACRTERDSLLWLKWFKKSCPQPHVSVPWLEAVLSLAANMPLTNSPLPSVESQWDCLKQPAALAQLWFCSGCSVFVQLSQVAQITALEGQ